MTKIFSGRNQFKSRQRNVRVVGIWERILYYLQESLSRPSLDKIFTSVNIDRCREQNMIELFLCNISFNHGFKEDYPLGHNILISTMSGREICVKHAVRFVPLRLFPNMLLV